MRSTDGGDQRAKVLVATPTADGKVYSRYMVSLVALIAGSKSRNDVEFIGPFCPDGALLAHSRNGMASILLEQPSFTHLLFIDSDMGFDRSAIYDLLDFDKPIVSCACPKRILDLDAFFDAAKSFPTKEVAWASTLQFVGMDGLITSPHPETGKPSYKITNGFAQTSLIGMGITLIRRDALETMKACHPELVAPATVSYKSMGVRSEIFQCFSSLTNEDGVILGEDMSFSLRWTALGGEIWISLNHNISHIGQTAFVGRGADKIRAAQLS